MNRKDYTIDVLSCYCHPLFCPLCPAYRSVANQKREQHQMTLPRQISTSTLIGIFFVLSWLVVPFPYFLAELGFVPLVRIMYLLVLVGAVSIADGDRMSWLFVVLLFAQVTLFSGVLLWGLRAWFRRIAQSTHEKQLRWLSVILICICFVFSLFPVYVTPVSSVASQSNLFLLLD